MSEIAGYLTVTEAAARLNCHRTAVWRHIRAGDLPTYRTARNSRVRLIDITDIEAIERVTQERAKRHDWQGKDWADLMLEAAANHAPERMADVLESDVYAEHEPEFPAVDDARGRQEAGVDLAADSDEWACRYDLPPLRGAGGAHRIDTWTRQQTPSGLPPRKAGSS